jgi:hypothetical protein
MPKSLTPYPVDRISEEEKKEESMAAHAKFSMQGRI